MKHPADLWLIRPKEEGLHLYTCGVSVVLSWPSIAAIVEGKKTGTFRIPGVPSSGSVEGEQLCVSIDGLRRKIRLPFETLRRALDQRLEFTEA